MATIVSDTLTNCGVNVTWAFDCGHTDVLFYGGREFADMDTYIAAKTKCLWCENAQLAAVNKPENTND